MNDMLGGYDKIKDVIEGKINCSTEDNCIEAIWYVNIITHEYNCGYERAIYFLGIRI